MTQDVSLNSIYDLLRRATAQTCVVWTGPQGPVIVRQETVSSLDESWTVPFVGEKMIREGEWIYGAEVQQKVQAWIEAHWSALPATQPPAGCVALDRTVPSGWREQLEAPTAARKLVLAAMFHGPDAVGTCATRFAQTGLIEVDTIYLLKGRSMPIAVELDDYVEIIPYREALRLRSSVLEPRLPGETWPPEDTGDICAIRVRRFESLGTERKAHYVSPLLPQGDPTALELLLGVVWGDGYSVFGHSSLVPLVISATLPFWTIGPLWGSSLRTTLLRFQLSAPSIKKRPFPSHELAVLVQAYANLDSQPRDVLGLAMRRLRDSAGRIDFEDKIIDICIALEALFTGREWTPDLKKTISGRGSWYYADTVQERDDARKMLKKLYETRRNIIHGNTTRPVGPWQDAESSKLLTDAENILRTCLKDMVVNGIPGEWEASRDHKSIWRDPPRPSSEIPSIKSDSLSWSVQEQEEIDRQLEKAWTQTISELPERPENAPEVTTHHSPNLREVREYRERGIPCVIVHPGRLYMAHPRWPKRSSDELDDRTLYYCEKDVGRHLEMWKSAAVANRADCFVLGNFAEYYHPRNRAHWPQPME